MVSLLAIAPLLLGIIALILPFLGHLSLRFKNLNNSIAILFFGSYVTQNSENIRRRANLLRSARFNEVYRTYASKTILYSTYAAIGGAIIGIYLLEGILRLLRTPEEIVRETLPSDFASFVTNIVVPDFSSLELLLLFGLCSMVFGAILGVGTFYYRWNRIQNIADDRSQEIEESLPRTVAFMFALSRSGMSHHKVVSTLAENKSYFGAAADEFMISLQDMRLSNSDFLSATKRLGRTSPSDEFANFAEDLANVLQTGQSLSTYLYDEYERYQEQKERAQDQILEEISALAEGYVALLVAGPLFLVTLLVVIGLLVGGTLSFLRVFVYIIIPLANLGFIVYISNFTASFGLDKQIDSGDASLGLELSQSSSSITDRPSQDESGSSNGSGADQANFERFLAYQKVRSLREWLVSPIESAIRSPTTILYPIVPLALGLLLIRVYDAYSTGSLSLATTDDLIIQSLLFIFVIFSIVQYFNTKRLKQIEDGLPDLIDRLADSTGAGMTLSTSFKRLDPESIPQLEDQIQHVKRDLELGSKTSDALYRFASRTKSVLVMRAVVLITNAQHASNNISPVLRIAADEAQLDKQLKRRRQQDLFIYRMIIYMSFVIFLGIVAALVLLFIPALPSDISIPGVGSGEGVPGTGGLGSIGLPGLSSVDRNAYTLMLFHSAIVQGIFAGLVAGKMSQGTIRAGVKHSTIMLIIAYIAMLVL